MPQKTKIEIKVLNVGTFHIIYDGSPHGHPGYIVWKDDEKNLYIAIKFGTSLNKNNFKLQKQIDSEKERYIYKRLFVGKRKDFGKQELTQFVITKEVKKLYQKIKSNNLMFSKNISSKDKKEFKNKKITDLP